MWNGAVMFCSKSRHDLELNSGLPAFSYVGLGREPNLSAEVAPESAARRKDRLFLSFGVWASCRFTAEACRGEQSQ